MHFIRYTASLLVVVSFISTADKGPFKLDSQHIARLEPHSSLFTPQYEPSPIFNYNNRNTMFVTLVDSAYNGYGLILPNTKPLHVTPEGWILGFRQWAGANGPSGQIGAAYSSNGLNWTIYNNLNPGLGAGRYPSAFGNLDYPYIFWNEYTTIGGGYGGRMYYSFDEFGWDGGSWSTPMEIDNSWNGERDQWVISPDHSFEIASDENWFNIVYDDWNRGNVWGMHSEAYIDGSIIFGSEFILFNENADFIGGTDEGSFTSSGILDINNDGCGFAAVTAYFIDGDVGGSPYANHHTIALKTTEDYGATWIGGQDGSNYFYIPDEVFYHMIDSGDFNLEWDDDCFDESLIISNLFLTYDFDMRVDLDGNPHIIVGVIGSDAGSVYPGYIDNALYYFTIDKDYLINPGEPQTATGWRYSKVLNTNNIWAWEDNDGSSYWQNMFPTIAISEENENVIWVVTSIPVQGEFFVTDDSGTPEDSCDDLGLYPEWNEEVIVIKSIDGGASWWCPYNATNTVPDCWVAENGELQCSPSEFCTDESIQNVPSEINAHAGTGATNDQVNLIFGRPDWCYGSTTGDMSGDDHKNRYYVGWVELTEEDSEFCGDCCGCLPGDTNLDGQVDILDIIEFISIVLWIDPFNYECTCEQDFNSDSVCDILDIVGIINCILVGDCLTEN